MLGLNNFMFLWSIWVFCENSGRARETTVLTFALKPKTGHPPRNQISAYTTTMPHFFLLCQYWIKDAHCNHLTLRYPVMCNPSWLSFLPHWREGHQKRGTLGQSQNTAPGGGWNRGHQRTGVTWTNRVRGRLWLSLGVQRGCRFFIAYQSCVSFH